jgi:D-alanyl-D-alanine carboxypeptidase/D-alanyl-D-alanine-endopeptidase (penicillin-binding protein 4)
VPPGGRRRTGLLAVLAAVLVLVAAVAGLAIVRPGPVAGWLGGDAGSGAGDDPGESTPVPVLADAGPGAPVPSQAGLQAAIGPLVGAATLGDRVHVSVADVSTGQALYDHEADVPTMPASVTKLVTAVTALAARGPAYRIPTRAVAGQAPGEVVLVGGGDPTLAAGATGFYPGAARLDQLAAQVKQALNGVAPTKVTIDATLFSGAVYGPGWDSDIPTGGFGGAITALMIDGGRTNPKASSGYAPRAAHPDVAAGQAFAKALGLPAGTVTSGRAPAAAGTAVAGATPGPGTELGRVESPPMARLVDVMLGQSDNIVAESLARQVALARNRPASFEGAAGAMNSVVGELGLPAAESSLSDGSGLSRRNRVSPELLTDLFVLAGNGSRPELAGIFGGLPVAGWSGTLDERFTGTAAAGLGVVRAKTGTLTGVHAISGVVSTADGRLLAFAVLADHVPTNSDPHPALDKIAATLAGCGCR